MKPRRVKSQAIERWVEVRAAHRESIRIERNWNRFMDRFALLTQSGGTVQ